MKKATGFSGENYKDYMILGQHGQDFLGVEWTCQYFWSPGSSSEQAVPDYHRCPSILKRSQILAIRPRPQIVQGVPWQITTLAQFSLSPVDVNELRVSALSFIEVIFSKQGYRKIPNFSLFISLSD
jgi:hypothetical protein